MKPTENFRWYVYTMGFETHPSGILYSGNRARVLQQWWHSNDEPPPSSNGEWRDVPMEWAS